ncbi:hypothetical protein QKT26_gp59 [Carcinus maenas nudivirus]|uniref:Uncharacterized protein n=1 Tax=Carcinus maenas nudivirus TaxID=2880837 RepID=A0AAE9BYV9_9VIRU|nr:hypothetical protein QKT26_gp59 [Carcinus maenas nudivirus]UBZ25649.1 hypothetical protein CmNV_058 [Carcinus maenas nudivirus]
MTYHRSNVYIVGEETGKIEMKSIHNEVYLNDGEHFLIRLENNHTLKMSAKISICGNKVGDFLVYPGKTFDIERPVDVNNKFKCVRYSDMSVEKKMLVDDVEKFDTVTVVVEYAKKVQPRSEGLVCKVDCISPKKGYDTVDSDFAGTVLSSEMSTKKYRTESAFETEDEVDTFIYKLRCNPKLNKSPESKLILE